MDSPGIGSDEDPEDVAPKNTSLWETILREYDERRSAYTTWERERDTSAPDVVCPKGVSDYLNEEIFPLLLPAMEEMLHQVQKCRFNGLDYIAAALWNRNPRHVSRSSGKRLDVFDIPTFKSHLRLHYMYTVCRSPRPVFPKSWLWSDQEAALLVQRCIRGWLVRKRDDVQELRQFWKALRSEKEMIAAAPNQDGGAHMEKTKKDKPSMDVCELYKLLKKRRERYFML